MTTEREVLLCLLKLTKAGPTSAEFLRKEARIPAQVTNRALKKLRQVELFRIYKGTIETSPSQRIRMAVQALELGADFQRVCRLLSWQEFEDIAAEAFEANGYQTICNFHFKQNQRKWEIDVIGLKQPLIVCVDCKHWKRGWQKVAVAKTVEAQIQRTRAFTEALPTINNKFKLENVESATTIPIVLSLTPGPSKFYNNVPVVSVLQLQDFINELALEARSLMHFTKRISHLSCKLTDCCQ